MTSPNSPKGEEKVLKGLERATGLTLQRVQRPVERLETLHRHGPAVAQKPSGHSAAGRKDELHELFRVQGAVAVVVRLGHELREVAAGPAGVQLLHESREL